LAAHGVFSSLPVTGLQAIRPELLRNDHQTFIPPSTTISILS